MSREDERAHERIRYLRPLDKYLEANGKFIDITAAHLAVPGIPKAIAQVHARNNKDRKDAVADRIHWAEQATMFAVVAAASSLGRIEASFERIEAMLAKLLEDRGTP